MAFKFIVNKSAGNVALNDGVLVIKTGDYIQVTEEVANEEYVADAVRKGWILVLDNTPGSDVLGSVPAAPVIEISKSPLEGSLTPPGKTTETSVDTVPEAVAPVADEAPVATSSAPASKKSGK